VGLFEGAAGELRVILTKRAGRLSSHSGLHLCPSLLQLLFYVILFSEMMDLWDNSMGWGNSILNELAVMVETIWVNSLFGVVGTPDFFFISNYLEETFET
jgi:hypothetical protein